MTDDNNDDDDVDDAKYQTNHKTIFIFLPCLIFHFSFNIQVFMKFITNNFMIDCVMIDAIVVDESRAIREKSRFLIFSHSQKIQFFSHNVRNFVFH